MTKMKLVFPVMLALIFASVGCSSDSDDSGGGGGYLVINDIPAMYEGKYAHYEDSDHIGAIRINFFYYGKADFTLPQISNRTVRLPMWTKDWGNPIVPFSGDAAAIGGDLQIHDAKDIDWNTWWNKPTARNFDITFTGGNAEVSWNDGY